MDNTSLLFTTDKKRLHKFFRTDPVLYSYHTGDLDDFYFENCQWAVCYGAKPVITETILIYHGLETASVLAFGQTEQFGSLLKELIGLLPPRFYCHFQHPHSEIFRQQFKETSLGTHMKMRLDHPDKLKAYAKPDKAITRLDSSHETPLRELYARAYPGNYFNPFMLASGKYLGWFENDKKDKKDKLAAVAGVHVHSDKYKVAVLGNITTDPSFRGQGLATKLTGALCHELSAENKLVCLNVKTDNSPAIKCYENLGFVKVHEYEEALYESG